MKKCLCIVFAALTLLASCSTYGDDTITPAENTGDTIDLPLDHELIYM